jgi:hypothetical protein
MKKVIVFLSVFLLTFLLGYFVVPQFMTKVEVPQVPELVQNYEPIIQTIEPKIEIQLEVIDEAKENTKNTYKVKLLETGEGYHGEQVHAKSGETWLGLFKKDNKLILEKTKIEIKKVYDIVVDDENNGEKTGKSVITESKNQSVFILKNADFLKEGEVKTYFGGNNFGDDIKEFIDYLPLRVGFVKSFDVDNEKYTLRVKKGINKKKEKITALVLENRNIAQTLHSLKSFDENDYLGTLIWAGDLDKDGKPDFYFDLYVHDNVLDKYLFLSSKSGKGKLVEIVAEFWTSGC